MERSVLCNELLARGYRWLDTGTQRSEAGPVGGPIQAGFPGELVADLGGGLVPVPLEEPSSIVA